jgi:hypothetical protein
VGVTIRNLGKVMIRIEDGKARAQQIWPSDNRDMEHLCRHVGENYPELEWQELDVKKRENWDIEIEPSESEEVHFDFVVSSNVQTICIYSSFTNQSKPGREKPIGWNRTTVHDLQRAHNGEPPITGEAAEASARTDAGASTRAAAARTASAGAQTGEAST